MGDAFKELIFDCHIPARYNLGLAVLTPQYNKPGYNEILITKQMKNSFVTDSVNINS